MQGKVNLVFLFFLMVKSLWGQNINFKHLTPDQGLSVNEVNCIAQDSKGFMWFGTKNGLDRYDGNKIVSYKNYPDNPNTISDNDILYLFVDNEGDMWVGTGDGGLNFYESNRNSFKTYRWTLNCSNCISNNTIRSITQGKDGLIWIGTDEGLNSLNKKTGKINTYKIDKNSNDAFADNQIYSLCEDKEGVLWIGTVKTGLIAFDKRTGKFNSNFPKGDFNKRIRCIYEDSRNNLWIGSDGGGLSLFDRNTGEFKTFKSSDKEGSISNNRIFSILEDKKGKLWVGSLGGGVNVFDYQSEKFQSFYFDSNDRYSLSSNHVRYVFEDKAESIWIATNTSGVCVYHLTSNQFGLLKKESKGINSLKYTPFGIIEDYKGLLWIGTLGGGLATLDRSNFTYTYYSSEENKNHENILTLFEDKDSLIWIGSWGGGLNYFDPKTKKFSKPFTASTHSINNNTVTTITQDEDGIIWIGTLNGLSAYNKKTAQFSNYTMNDGLSSNSIFALSYDAPRNTLWIGSNGGGLNSLNTKTGKIEFFRKTAENPEGISNNNINCIYDDNVGNLWIGTKKGLNKFEKKTKTFKKYYDYNGLANDYIYGILPGQDGDLWISTNKGLSRFLHLEKEGNLFKNYYAMDGLQDNEFNQGAYFKSYSGELFFGGVNGLNCFYPSKIIQNKHVPPIVLTSFKKFGKEVELDSNIINKSRITLSFKDNFLEFEFCALDFVLPSKNLYSYRLEGFDDEWTTVSTKNYAVFTNLQGGDYVLRVKGSNNDGLWNEQTLALQIIVRPPFYKTNWFYTLCVLCSLISVFSYTRYRTSRIKKEKKKLELKVRERTTELAQKNKDITSSIQYAQRIQEAILPKIKVILDSFPNSFILYKPKDIVSGDFYWFSEKNNLKIIAVVDCTGHGVPGAFMSMIGHNLLNQIVVEKGITSPGEILAELDAGIQSALKQSSLESDTRDGMDVSLCAIDLEKGEINYSGAFRPLYIVRKNKIIIYNGNRFPVGGSQGYNKMFESNCINFQKDDIIYLFSDGFADQFGGEKLKKFMVKNFQKLLLEINELPMSAQHDFLDKAIQNWMGLQDQVDDILIVGIKF